MEKISPVLQRDKKSPVLIGLSETLFWTGARGRIPITLRAAGGYFSMAEQPIQ